MLRNHLTGSFQKNFMLSMVCPFLEMTLVPETGEADYVSLL